MELIIKHFDELTTRELYALLQARESVFVLEQNCLYKDIDDRDFLAYHVFFQENSQILACVRVFEQDAEKNLATIGRVLTVKRGDGLGRKIMQEGIRVAREKLKAEQIYIEAQAYAKGFYEKLGFKQTSEEFLEDGIPHIEMLLTL